MNLVQWANEWGVPLEALEALRKEFGVAGTDPSPRRGDSERAITSRIRLEASRKGVRVWRNNVGACKDQNNNIIRYGLANESPKMNAVVKSSDLIGIRPVIIQHHHVGHMIGQFLAREVKSGSWSYTGTQREEAQLRFLELVSSLGGDASFANSEGTL